MSPAPDDHPSLPFDRARVRSIIEAQGFDVRRGSIREMNKLVNTIERELGVDFIRMEFGVPGLPTPQVAVDAEIAALRDRNVANTYAPFDGLPELKAEIARFARLYLDVEISPRCCIPTVGAMQGSFAAIAVTSRMDPARRTLLCLEPGFPVNKLQMRLLDVQAAGLDLYHLRGQALLDAIEERVQLGDVFGVLWSSPNNPSWICLKDWELAGIARLCERYDLVAIEDLAYFGMDTRIDCFTAGEPPYQPSILQYTQRAFSIISCSKIFSYAGQRIAMTLIGPELAESQSAGLASALGTASVHHAFVHGVLYPVTACGPESPQYGLLALLRAANAGDRSLFEPAAEYARRARIMKQQFLNSGFNLVYDNDLGEPLADGFYFTVACAGFDDGADLLLELLHYGVSAITLGTTGSCRTEGLRACVSLTDESQFDTLAWRLACFRRDHPQ